MSSWQEITSVKPCEPYYSGVCQKVLTVKLPKGQYRAKLFHNHNLKNNKKKE